MSEGKRKPWLCRLGMHDWHRVGDVELCRHCHALRWVFIDTGGQ